MTSISSSSAWRKTLGASIDCLAWTGLAIGVVFGALVLVACLSPRFEQAAESVAGSFLVSNN